MESYRVAMFAYNEAKNIRRAVLSVLRDMPAEVDLKIFVLINGCTDNTADVVDELVFEYPDVIVPVHLPFGDKSNAWNAYVWEYCDDSAVHFFMDGDVECGPDALPKLQAALLADEHATGIGGYPLTGRNKARLGKLMLERKWIYGNLYAVKGTHLDYLRQLQFRLPIGVFWEDDLISRVLKVGRDDPSDVCEEQVIHLPGVGYAFRSLSPLSLDDITIHFKRRITYRLSMHQLLKFGKLDMQAVPRSMDGINRDVLAKLEGETKLKWRDRKVRDRLRRMYGTPYGTYFDERLPQAA